VLHKKFKTVGGDIKAHTTENMTTETRAKLSGSVRLQDKFEHVHMNNANSLMFSSESLLTKFSILACKH